MLSRTSTDIAYSASADVSLRSVGAFNFGQKLIPLFLSNKSDNKGILIFSGATMSIRGGARFSTMAPGMFGRRALAQSLAREFGPKGVHVAHVILDGLIDTPRAGEIMGPDKDNKVSQILSSSAIY